MRSVITFLFLVSFSFIVFGASAQEDKKIITIGTGSKNALAYPVISSICEVFNKYNSQKSASCIAISTQGSEDNLNGIGSKKYDAGVVKSDMAYGAYNGIGVFGKKPYRNLRSVFGLHKEYLTIIIGKNSQINSLSDFKNKRIYIGNKGSGSRILVDKLFQEAKFKNSDFKELHEESADKIHDLFCGDKIDAAIYLIGHPNNIFSKTLSECNTKIIGLSRKELENYVDTFRHMYPAAIKKGTYPNQKTDINTFAAQLLLVTSDNMNEEEIYNFVQVVSDHYQEIQSKNQTLKNVELFSPEVNAIPMHKGAIRFYKNFISQD